VTGPEMTAMALHFAIRQLDTHDPVSWEDVPLLDEDDFRWLLEEIEDIANDLRRRLAEHEHVFGVRAAAIRERVS
jgi:hypothetical protein